MGFLASAFEALGHDEAFSLLVQCIVQLPLPLKKILALYYYENFSVTEIADCLGLPEDEIDQIRAKTLGILRTMLASRLFVAQIPGGQLRSDSFLFRAKIGHRPPESG
jgi:DNA-directed RNA polymerase specialized sigma24 family protein